MWAKHTFGNFVVGHTLIWPIVTSTPTKFLVIAFSNLNTFKIQGPLHRFEARD